MEVLQRFVFEMFIFFLIGVPILLYDILVYIYNDEFFFGYIVIFGIWISSILFKDQAFYKIGKALSEIEQQKIRDLALKYANSTLRFVLKAYYTSTRASAYVIDWVKSSKLTSLVVFMLVFVGLYKIFFLESILSIRTTEVQLRENLLFLSGINDKEVIGVLVGVNKIILTILPLSLPLYYFIYREQKAISDSVINKQNNTNILLSFYSTVIFTSICIYKIVYDYNYLVVTSRIGAATKLGTDLTMTIKFSEELVVVLSGLFLSVVLFYVLVYNLFKSINIRYLIESMTMESRKAIFRLSYITPSAVRGKEYRDIHVMFESVYQMLSQSIQKNLNETFYKNYKVWDEVIQYLRSDSLIIYIDNRDRCLYLLKRDGETFISLYKSILKNQLGLIIFLFSNNKIAEAYKCLETFFYLKPPMAYKHKSESNHEDQFYNDYRELFSEYTSVLTELARFVVKLDKSAFQQVISHIEDMANEGGYTRAELIGAFEVLLTLAVESEEVKVLSTLAYSMHKISNMTTGEDNHLSTSTIAQAVAGKVGVIDQEVLALIEGILPAEVDNNDQVIGDDNNQELTGQYISILLQATLKAVETSSYKAVGFLVKFLVSNFPSSILSKCFDELVSVQNRSNSLEGKNKYLSSSGVKYSFNSAMERYCLEKLAILLFIQQKYLISRKVTYIESKLSYVSLSVVNRDNINYFVDNVTGAKSNYGLPSLHDEKFISDMKRVILNFAKGE